MKKSNIFFATDAAKLFLPWMSMLMSFIAVLIIAAGMTSYALITDWQTTVSGSLTVQIPTYTDNGETRGDKVARDIETVLTIVRSSEGVLGATVLSDEQMAVLMEPWLSGDVVLSELPVPKLIDVMVDPNHTPDVAQLKADLAEQVPSAVLDSHRLQLEPLIRMSGGIVKLIGFILILLALTASFSVIYATKSSLSAHEYIISLTHMMGANDAFIIRQYAVRHFILTFVGALFGFLLALPIMAGVSFFIRGTSFHWLFSCEQWGVLLAVPAALALLAFVTTIKTVSDYLKRFL